ncbi:GNAT family N-acetyltransferase [Kribbella sp. NBC_01505]|uniref:GNAT family N-acetyltransferase n=1 Tax=Kribbella sp. NBC_01505 TaxID=2903580 RepID=UPI003863A8CC
MEIGPATRGDVDQLIGSMDSPAAQHHVLGRWEVQRAGDGAYLLARRAGVIVGQTVVLKRSKYAELQAAEDPAEINGLDAFVRNEGIGTALVRAAEVLARDWGRAWIGLGVGPENDGARRLYERLGYHLWSGPRVIDRWTEQAADGSVVRSHADECDYLLKPL